jgi:hypothetical protein
MMNLGQTYTGISPVPISVNPFLCSQTFLWIHSFREQQRACPSLFNPSYLLDAATKLLLYNPSKLTKQAPRIRLDQFPHHPFLNLLPSLNCQQACIVRIRINISISTCKLSVTTNTAGAATSPDFCFQPFQFRSKFTQSWRIRHFQCGFVLCFCERQAIRKFFNCCQRLTVSEYGGHEHCNFCHRSWLLVLDTTVVPTHRRGERVTLVH